MLSENSFPLLVDVKYTRVIVLDVNSNHQIVYTGNV